MSTIRFELRAIKKDKQGKAPILLNYQIRGQRKYYNTSFKIYPECWDIKNQQAAYLDKKTAKKLLPSIKYDLLLSSKEVQEFNTSLIALQKDIAAIENRFELDKI